MPAFLLEIDRSLLIRGAHSKAVLLISAAFVPRGTNPGEFDKSHWEKELRVVRTILCIYSKIQEGRSPGEKGWEAEAGEERAASWIPKVAGEGRNGKFLQHI